jgi:hypothetical protein
MVPDFHSIADMIASPFWGTAALAAVLAIIAVIAILRFGGRQVLGAVAAAVLIGGVGWLAFDRLDMQGRAEQRRAIEARVMALNAQALLPNSNLACLDAAGGDVLHEACEKALFAAPEQVAAALNYIGSRLDVVREIAALPARDAAAYENLSAPLVRSLEADRFGLVAQILIARDDCKPASCYAFDFLPHHDRVIANMKERAYDTRVARFAATWTDKAGAPPAGPALAAQSASPSHNPVNINFPTADSIPAVSIMSNEPGRPGQNGVGAPPRPEPRPQPQASAPQTLAPPLAQTPPQASQAPAPPRRPAQKAQTPRAPAASPPAAPESAADPFPVPVGSAQQTTGTQQQ